MAEGKQDQALTRELSGEQRAAIALYFKRLSIYIGVPNLIFIICSLLYIYFALPEKAVQAVEVRFREQTQPITDMAVQQSLNMIFESGKAQATIKRAEELGGKIDHLEENLESLKRTSPLRWAEIFKHLEGQQGAKNVLETATAVQKLQTRLRQSPNLKACEWVGVPAGTEAVSLAICPNNKIAAGVSQRYHGGSWRNWIESIYCCELSLAN